MDSIYWYNGLIILGMLLSIPCFFFGNKAYQTKHLIIFLHLLVISISEVKARQLFDQELNNSLINNIGYLAIGISLIFIFFYFSLDKNKYILFLWAGYLMWMLINSIFFQPINTTFQNHTWALSSLMIIGFSFYFFYSILVNNKYEEQNLLSIPDFWIVMFLLFFSACSFLYFASLSFYYAEMDRQLRSQLNLILKILGTSMYLVMGLAFYAPLVFKSEPKLVPK